MGILHFLYWMLALGYIWFKSAEKQHPLSALLKALPILILAYLALMQAEGPVRLWLLLALLFSAGGDIALTFVGERAFIGGLLLFLTAHLCYIVALLQQPTIPTAAGWLILSLLFVYATLLLRRLLPNLGTLKIPVLFYVTVILGMGIAAVVHAPFSGWLIAGAVLFMLSDSMIALDRFAQPIPNRDMLVMGSYYGAQYLLATALF